MDVEREPLPQFHLTKHVRKDVEMDVLTGSIWEIGNVLRDNIGFVSLMDVMPRKIPQGTTMDEKVADVARTSYGEGTRTLNDNKSLIRYLLQHKHTTPFEFIQFDFMVVVPIFVRAQLIRHRTAAYNEESARYSIVRDERYVPPKDRLKKQSKTNKQGSANELISDVGIKKYYDMLDSGKKLYEEYEVLVNEHDLARELARLGLTQNTYTRYRFTMNLHNLLHLLHLRLDPHAQEETRNFAKAMYMLVQPLVPITIEAFEDYVVQAVTLSRMEALSISKKSLILLESTNKREQGEYIKKLKELQLYDEFAREPDMRKEWNI